MVDTTEVRSKHKFDETSLHLYLKSNLDCFPKGNEVLKIRQFSHGQSNPSFYLQKAGQKFVLRKKPSGQLLKGAHQIQREFLIQSALHKALFPTPKPLLFCADTGVIGTEFYIMEFVEGRIFRSAQLIVWTPNQRKNIYSEMSRVLTWLHSIDWRALGLEDFGRHGNYCARQVSTWSKQYKSSETHKIDSINKLMEWLPNHLPSDDPEATVITHGDYKIDNIVFHPTQDRIIAVLDWELSTLGHPYSDLGYSCLPYHWPYDIPVLPATSLG